MKANVVLGTNVNQYRDGDMQSITFVVTQDCNLRCTYCYEHYKNPDHRMSIEVARRAVDFFLSQPVTKPAVVFEFTGGEPTLEIGLVGEIVRYFRTAIRRLPYHPWHSQYVFQIGTNGTRYCSREVQQFLWENRPHAQAAVTIDGTKAKHDMHRVFVDGRGSYDMVVESVKLWVRQYPNATTKVTFSSDDLPYLCESIVHLWDLGIKTVPGNVVFEDVWKPGDPDLFESQLKQLADIALDRGYWSRHNTTLFWIPVRKGEIDESDRNWCGSGKMVAVDSEGNLFPCLRFMGYSFGSPERHSWPVGSIYEGYDPDKMRAFHCLRKSTQSPPECLTCEADDRCAWCSGYNYDATGTVFKRVTFICQMHQAQRRANQYYWDQLEKRYGLSPADVPSRTAAPCYC